MSGILRATTAPAMPIPMTGTWFAQVGHAPYELLKSTPAHRAWRPAPYRMHRPSRVPTRTAA